MNKIISIFLLFFICACTKPTKYNCYILDWDIISYDGEKQPYIYTKNEWKNITNSQAEQEFEKYRDKQCNRNEIFGFYCDEKTDNSFIEVHNNIIQSSPKSMFCIPLTKDMAGIAEKYVNDNIDYVKSVKDMFPFEQ